MQQTSGSSCSNRTGGGETAMNEVAVGAAAAVDEGTMDEVALVVSVSSLLMVFSHCDRSIGLERTIVWVCFTVRQGK